MTVAEIKFLELVPIRLKEIALQLEELNSNLSTLTKTIKDGSVANIQKG